MLAACLHAFKLALAALLMPTFQLPNFAKTPWQIHATCLASTCVALAKTNL